MSRILPAAFFVVSSFSLCGGVTVRAQTILLDDFEASSIRQVNPSESDPGFRDLWNVYQGEGGLGVASISTDTSFDGNQSLKLRYTKGHLDFQLYPYQNSIGGWQWMRKFVQPPENWQMDTFNRMRFWIKIPPGINKNSGGHTNVEFGTYVRKSNGDVSSAESGGDHYYHFYDLFYTGEWHQVIVDMHPNHKRGGDGSREWGNLTSPTGETGFNYFDAMTRFYINMPYASPGNYPADYYLDGFSFYRETRPENIDQVYSLNGVFVPSSNKIIVGWMRNKNENEVKHEVRYAFSDIHDTGWGAATQAPGGIITPPGWQGYNAMDYETTGIDVQGKSTVYIAIKPENSDLFSQIAIPTSGNSIPPVCGAEDSRCPINCTFEQDADCTTPDTPACADSDGVCSEGCNASTDNDCVRKAPELTSPVPGSTLNDSSVTFAWSQGAGVSEYWLGVGTSIESVSADPWGDLFAASTGTTTGTTVLGLPESGTLYVRLWYDFSTDGSEWRTIDYSYKLARGTVVEPPPPTCEAAAIDDAETTGCTNVDDTTDPSVITLGCQGVSSSGVLGCLMALVLLNRRQRRVRSW
ncbi:MAG: hypothetical protein R3C68_02700 [Myxococcota bacterium]